MSARRPIFNALVAPFAGNLPVGHDEAKQLLDAYRAEVIAERDAETVAWLVKKAREFRANGKTTQANTAAVLASKVERGAVRSNNLRMLAANFFEPGRTYRSRRCGDFRFRCLSADAHPDTGDLRAFGWRYSATPNVWRPADLDGDDWACCGWTDTDEDGAQ